MYRAEELGTLFGDVQLPVLHCHELDRASGRVAHTISRAILWEIGVLFHRCCDSRPHFASLQEDNQRVSDQGSIWSHIH